MLDGVRGGGGGETEGDVGQYLVGEGGATPHFPHAFPNIRFHLSPNEIFLFAVLLPPPVLPVPLTCLIF